MILNKFLLSFFLFVFSLSVYSNNVMEVKDAHGNTIIFKENLKGESNIEIIQKNKQGEDRLLLKLPYLAEHPKISSFFITKIKDRGDYLIVSTKIQPSFNATGVPYVDDYFI
ncbi:hypothetical protein [Actinobacillus equuli]|nr:hypothetical protein [Actinobacillus equuli]WGE47486.1 hypothetical protein NYR84_04640 [Actinobacillus equuli subsp. haemolyticus]